MVQLSIIIDSIIMLFVAFLATFVIVKVLEEEGNTK